MRQTTTESQILRELLPELEADGYEVYLRPQKPNLPAFLGSFTPDAIARRSDKNLVIEVMSHSAGAAAKLEQINALLADQGDWALQVVWVSPTGPSDAPRTQNAETIEERIKEIRDLASSGHVGPAMLLAWATFEALCRALLSKRFERPQTPGRLVRVLAEEGHLTPTQADYLRSLAEKRNKFVHGGLQTRFTKTELSRFTRILDDLLAELKETV